MEPPVIESVLESRLPLLPTTPGVYLFRDKAGDVIYVGKAKNLRARVRQYARGGDGCEHYHFGIGDVDYHQSC